MKKTANRMMIVECNALIQSHLKKEVINETGCSSINQAYSYKEALYAFPHFWPDIVFLDASLDDGNSMILLQIFKAIKPEVKVIVMENSPTDQFQKICRDSGASDFFEKSNFDQPLFWKQVKNQLLWDKITKS